MSRSIRNACWVGAAALAMFLTGAALASDGNYCEDFDSGNCIVTDITEQDSCCMNLDGTLRDWTCTREIYECFDVGGPVAGPGYNCHSPGAQCR